MSCLPPVQLPSLLMLGAVLCVYRSWTRCLPSMTAFCFPLLPTIISHRKFPLSFNQIFAEALKFVRNKAPPGTQTGRIIEKLMHVASNSSHVFAPASPNFALLSQRKVTLSSQAEKRFCSWAHLQGLEGKQIQENQHLL